MKNFSKIYFVCAVAMCLLTPLSYILAVTTDYVDDSAAQQAQIDAATKQMSAASYNGPNTNYSQNGTNYSGAMGSCAGKIVGKYLANLVSGWIKSKVTNTIVSKVLSNAVPIEQGSFSKLESNLNSQTQRQGSMEYYNQYLTPLAVCIANELVQAMTASTIQWINSGFKNPDGTTGPGFVSNPSKFFQGIADRETAGFLGSISGNLLCKPFSIQVRLALLNDYRGSYQGQAQCTLASIKNNFQNFGKGENGGTGNYWNDWFQLTQQDNNNYMGSYFLARDQLSKNTAYNQDMNRLQITIDRGFLAMKKCPNGGSACAEKDKITTTPGSQVEDSLNRVLNLQGERINIANSFDDIISALVGQVFKMAIGGLQGNNK